MHKVLPKDNIQAREQGEYLREIIKRAIVNQWDSLTQFAQHADIDRADLSKFLDGKRDWSLTKVLHIFCHLDTTLKVEIDKARPYYHYFTCINGNPNN